MNFRIFAITILLTLALSSNAQIGNTWTIGGTTTFISERFIPKGVGANSNFTDLRVSLTPGYFFDENIVGMLGIGVHSFTSDRFTGGSKNNNAIINPMVRYYFNGDKISPFVSVGYIFERGKNNSSKIKGDYISLGAGGSYMIGEHFALEASVNYNFGKYEDRFGVLVVEYKYRQTLWKLGCQVYF